MVGKSLCFIIFPLTVDLKNYVGVIAREHFTTVECVNATLFTKKTTFLLVRCNLTTKVGSPCAETGRACLGKAHNRLIYKEIDTGQYPAREFPPWGHPYM